MLKNIFRKKSRRIYLDYAAATPLRREVEAAMSPYQRSDFGNASSIHTEGRVARTAVEEARRTIARILKSREDEVYVTSGGTEGNNLAVQGFLRALRASGRAPLECEIVTTGLEHPSILEVIPMLTKEGYTIHQVPVDGDGLMKHQEFLKLLSPRTSLITFSYAASEIGVVQDVKKITHAVRLFRKEHKTPFPYVHIDACQAPLYLPIAVDSLGVDMMTLDAGKFYGPKGVGVLYRKHNVPLAPLFAGGGQESGLRSGTENTALIVGCAEAVSIAARDRESRAAKVEKLRDYAFEKIVSLIDGVVVNGSRAHRLANNINISIPGIDGTFAVVVLDTKGIAVSTKSACSGASGSGSKAVYAMGGDDARALSTIRATLGEATTKADVDAFVYALKAHVEKTRADMEQLTDR